MNPIRTNKPVFFGDNGEILKSGNIYIGQPNQWPLSFPKTVTLQDSAGSQFTASQPLRTNVDGRITYNGKAMIALVDGDYSMLVRDRNGVTVGDGYTPFIENSADEVGLSGVTQVGTLLSDIKQFNVTPGDTVRNVGKDTALDGFGGDWLVVSNTGDPADDFSLIDFANGTQGRRTSISQSIEVELGGAFDAGMAIKVSRNGDQVTISPTSPLTHQSLSLVTSGPAVPSWAVPSTTMSTMFAVSGTVYGVVSVAPAGGYAIEYFAFSGGSPARADSGIGDGIISYNI